MDECDSAVIGKQLDRIVEAAHRMFADVLEIEIAFDEVGKGTGQQHRFPPNCLVRLSRREAMLTGGTDHGEVEPAV